MRSWYATWDSSSSLSNLSASAPPFTVTPSAPSPDSGQNMNSGDGSLRLPVNSSPNSWVSPNPPVSVPDWLLNPVDRELHTGENPYSSSYPYGDFSGGSRNKVDEVRIYYPQYYFPELDYDKPLTCTNQPSYDGVSASRGATASGSVYNDKTSTLSSLSSPLHVSDVRSEATNRAWYESAPFEGSFWSAPKSGADGSIHRSYENQGAHSFEGFDANTEASNNINFLNRGNHTVSTSSPLLNLFPRNMTEGTIDSPPTAHSGSISVLPEAYSSAPPLDFCLEPRNYQMGYSNMVDKCSLEHFSGQGNGCSVVDSILSSAGLPLTAENSERNVLLDESRLRVGQGENNIGIGKFCFGDVDYLKNDNVGSSDASDQLSSAVLGLEVPCMVFDGLNIAHESSHVFSSYENVSEAFNHYGYSVSVDSPCWKGVPIKRFGSSKACEIAAPDRVSEFKNFNSLNPQISQVSAENGYCDLNILSQRHSELPAQEMNRISGKNSALPVDKSEVQHTSALGVRFGDVLEVGSCHLRPSYSCRTQGSEDVNARWKRNASVEKLAGDVSVKLSQAKRNDYGHDAASKEKKPSADDGSNLELKMNDAINIGLSDVSFRCVEHVLNSPPSTIEAFADHSAFYLPQLTPRMDAPLLVRTILNLSELLLLHISNGASDLKEQDYEVLKKGANNLEACCLKDVELVSGSKESKMTVQGGPVFHGESFEHQKNEEPEQHVGSSVEDDDQENPASATNVEHPPSVTTSAGNMHSLAITVEDGLNPSGVFSRSDITRYNKLSQIGMLEGTQLSNQKEKHCVLPGISEGDNSDDLTCRGLADIARQDKVTQDIKRILAENFHDEDGSEPQTCLFKNLWLEAEAALCSVNYMARYNQMKLQMVKPKASDEKDPHENAMPIPSNFTPNCHGDVDIPSQRSMEATDGDVMARFNLLKARERDTETEDAEVEHPSPKLSDESSAKFDASSAFAVGSSTNQPEKMDASVMARFALLKQRDDMASSRRWNLAALESINLESAVKQDYFPVTNDSTDASAFSDRLGYALLPQDGDSAAALMQSSASFMVTNPQVGTSCEGSPLEWEHVQKEEINSTILDLGK